MTNSASNGMDHDVADLGLAAKGKARIEWAERDMPVLRAVRTRFDKEQPFQGLRMSCCLHVTAETANLMRTLQAGGADVALVASNPLSTQDDVAASLVSDFNIPVYAKRGEDRDTFFAHIRKVLELKPQITMDDGADLVSVLHKEFAAQLPEVLGSMEETTTGVIRLRAMAKDGALKIPVVAVNDARTKHFFDNRYGTGQSTMDGIIRATGKLIAGTTFVVAGYGWGGKGLAARARGMGASVVVTETDPLKALEALMDGFRVMPMLEAAETGDIFCTLTGDKAVITTEHISKMKDGAVVANSGHFDVEVDVAGLKKIAGEGREVKPNVREFIVNGRRIYLLAEGRLVNLAAAEGHPASVMDMSFATQALSAEWVVKNKGKLSPQVYDVPAETEDWVARLKLEAMGVKIDKLSEEQSRYLADWKEGT